MELEELKVFIRVDGEDEDVLISTFKAAAEAYLLNAGIKEDYTNKLYKLAVMLLVSHSYETRLPVLIGSISKNVEYSLQGIILQLQLSQQEVAHEPGQTQP